MQIILTSRGLAASSATALRALLASDEEFARREGGGWAAFDQPLGSALEVSVRKVRIQHSILPTSMHLDVLLQMLGQSAAES